MKNSMPTNISVRAIDMLTVENLNNNHEFTQKHIHLLHEPIFTIKALKSITASLTYRKLNEWDAKGLICSSRKTKDIGWRKFSIVGVVRLRIISDFREIGFSSRKIKRLLDRIPSGITVQKNKMQHLELLDLEHAIFLSLAGIKFLLLIRKNEEVYFLIEDDELFFSFYYDDDECCPAIVLPFFSYTEELRRLMKERMGAKKSDAIAASFFNVLRQQKRIIERYGDCWLLEK